MNTKRNNTASLSWQLFIYKLCFAGADHIILTLLSSMRSTLPLHPVGGPKLFPLLSLFYATLQQQLEQILHLYKVQTWHPWYIHLA